MPKFDEEENIRLNENIKSTVAEIGEQIHKCEKAIENLSNEKTSNETQKQFKDNIKLYLITEFSEFTRRYKYNQEIYIRKYKELGGEEEKMEKNEIQNENYLLKTEKMNNLQKRDQELGELLNSMENLASTFNDLKIIVMEQGTILDRIDYNIEASAINVSKGKQHLINAHEMQKNSCFKRAILALIFILFVESVLLIMKIL